MIIFPSPVIGTGLRWQVVGISASPELEYLVFGPSVKGLACARSCGFAALTLDCRSSDQGMGWLSGEAEMW